MTFVSLKTPPDGRRGGRAARLALSGLLGYLVGTFPTADLVSRRFAAGGDRMDLRSLGTGNPGALNAAKVLGPRAGLVVLAGDALKGAVAALAGRRIAPEDGAYVAGIGAVTGHCLPLWRRFRGGKGIATSAGTAIVCFPAYMPLDLALAGGMLALSKGRAGTATYAASSVFVAAATYWAVRGVGNLWGPRATAWLPIYAAATSALIAAKFLTAPRPPPDSSAETKAAPSHGVDRAERAS